jgi:hypothetical protein
MNEENYKIEKKEKNNDSANILLKKENDNEKGSIKIIKRHRRKKLETDIRDYKCLECGKCYLSLSALKNHLRTKHDYGKNEKKGRGRPKKDFKETDFTDNMKEKLDKFYKSQKKNKIEEKNDNPKRIDTSFLKNLFNELYINHKNELFNSIDKIEEYNFYDLLIKNWEKRDENFENKSRFSMLNCFQSDSLVDKPPIDIVFFLYLKYLSKKNMNLKYFCFIFKYITIFREYINKEKKNSINKKFICENKNEYTQIYDAEIIPDLFNDFLMDFMESNNYFGLNKDEIIQLIEFFCYWLFTKGYTVSHISKIDN